MPCVPFPSCVRLSSRPWTVACQAPLPMEFSRQGCWSGVIFPTPGGLPDPGVKPVSLASPALAGRFFTTVPPGRPHCIYYCVYTLYNIVVIWDIQHRQTCETQSSLRAGGKVAATAKSLQLCLTLCDPIDGSLPGPPVPGTLQARTLEWVSISFSNAWKWKVKVKLLSVQLLATPWTAAHQAPLSMGFSRQEYWSGVPLPSPKSKFLQIFLERASKESMVL